MREYLHHIFLPLQIFHLFENRFKLCLNRVARRLVLDSFQRFRKIFSYFGESLYVLHPFQPFFRRHSRILASGCGFVSCHTQIASLHYRLFFTVYEDWLIIFIKLNSFLNHFSVMRSRLFMAFKYAHAFLLVSVHKCRRLLRAAMFAMQQFTEFV